MVEVAIVGGGIAGLAAAWRLFRRGVDVRVLEAGARAGGFVGTIEKQGFVIEEGPGSVRGDRPFVKSLVRELGLEGAIEPASPAAKRRWIWANGALHPLPASPPAFMKSKLLSARGKLRVLSEPFQPARRDGGDETLAAFIARRIGDEAVDVLLDPFVAGVFAGDPHVLGVDAFPMLGAMEREHGSLFGAMRARGGLGGGIYSLAGGLGVLPRAIGAALGDRLVVGTRVDRIEARDEGVRIVVGDDVVEAKRVIVATSARDAARLVPAALGLGAIPHAPIFRVELGFATGDVADPLDGFGLLCASKSPLPGGAGPVLGVIYTSSVFSGRAPAGHHLLSVMLGGARDPGVVDRSDEALITQARGVVEALLGVRAAPVMTHLSRWPGAIPQYRPGHLRAVAEVVKALPSNVRLAGNYLQGPGVEDTVASGLAAADAFAS